jgi:hypothetical protein
MKDNIDNIVKKVDKMWNNISTSRKQQYISHHKKEYPNASAKEIKYRAQKSWLHFGNRMSGQNSLNKEISALEILINKEM